jgi:hypothetical protein
VLYRWPHYLLRHYAMSHHTACRNAERHYAIYHHNACPNAERRYAMSHHMDVVMLTVIMLCVPLYWTKCSKTFYDHHFLMF